MRGGGPVAVHRQVVQERAYVRGIEVPRMGRVVKADVADDPPAVTLFRVAAKVTAATGRVDPVEQGGSGVGGWRGHAMRVFKFEKLTSHLYYTSQPV